MRKFIVTTTINPVTEAIRRFAGMAGWQLIIVTDRKTPKDYVVPGAQILTPEKQEAIDHQLSDAIGWNCIQRRNFGFIHAHRQDADIIATVDDDNIPYPDWGKNLLIGQKIEVDTFETSLPCFDPVGAVTNSKLWHRGYPLQLLSKRDYSNKRRATIVPHVQADFWNGDPDVDAICRMEHAPNLTFADEPFPFAANKMSPFNSQNTFLTAKVLRNYFLYPHVGRMDDIFASFYAQALGAKVVFNKASVFQDRNVHDLTRDLKAEFLGYEHNFDLVVGMSSDPEALNKVLPPRALEAFSLYRRHFKGKG